MTRPVRADSPTYPLWHGITPMADFFRDSEPDMRLVSGAGSRVTDEAGRSYLDARSSMWNVTLGYSCEPVKEAIRRQLDVLPSGTVMRYEHPTSVAVEYATRLARLMPAPVRHIRFGNTGSQMTEAAGMLSRFHRLMTGERGRDTIIALHHSYHGTGPLATALTGEPVLHEYSGPLDSRVRHAATPTVESVVEVIDAAGPENVTAVIIEPVMGTCIAAAPLDLLNGVIELCRARDIHVILDEVTTGAGRAGTMTVSERLAAPPDMIVLGKGLSAGYFPLAALAVTTSIYEALEDPQVRIGFPNGSTTDGHPLGMAAGLAVLDILTADGFFQGVRATGAQLSRSLVEAFADVPQAGSVGGEGLMLGLNLVHGDGTAWGVGEVNRLRLVCRDHGLLTSYSDGALPLIPPLTITPEESGELVDRLGRALRAHLAGR